MTPENLFDTSNPVREYQVEDSTSRDEKNNIEGTTEATTIENSIFPMMNLFNNNSSVTTKRGSYGTLDFLTLQTIFDNVFDKICTCL